MVPWTLAMDRGPSSRCVDESYYLIISIITDLLKLMLQTAPVLLLFPPTSGPDAKADGQPLRFEFTQG